MSIPTRNLIVYGAGGFGQEVVSMSEAGCRPGPNAPHWHVIGYVDDTPGYEGQIFHGVPCLGSLDAVKKQREGQETWCFVALGDNQQRRDVVRRIKACGWKSATIIHDSSMVAWDAEIGEGSYIGSDTGIAANVKIGKHVFIDTRVSIGHHVLIGDFAQVDHGAALLGHSTVERGATIGTHGVVMANVTIGAWATVAVGTPALRNVKPGHTISLPLAQTIFKLDPLPDDDPVEG